MRRLHAVIEFEPDGAIAWANDAILARLAIRLRRSMAIIIACLSIKQNLTARALRRPGTS